MAAYQAPPSLGSSRQEHWSGLPFPSPMHERNGTDLNLKPFFAQQRKQLTKQKEYLLMGEIAVNDETDEGLISKVHKQLIQLNIKKYNTGKK